MRSIRDTAEYIYKIQWQLANIKAYSYYYSVDGVGLYFVRTRALSTRVEKKPI